MTEGNNAARDTLDVKVNRVFAGKIVIIHGPYYLGKLAGVDVNDYRAVEKALDLEAVEADSIVRSVIKAQSRAK